jgi:5-methylcytosine-specific restriction endonuclease McrA
MGTFGNPALVLNTDFRPLSYYPLSVWSWQDAINAVLLGRVNIIENYDKEAHSPSLTIKLPSVLALKKYIILKKSPAFTRFNVFLRDNFTCQYCHEKFLANDLTFDHIIPKCVGGKTTWENVVSACTSCNVKKGRKLLKYSVNKFYNLKKGRKLLKNTDMHLERMPYKPTSEKLQKNGRNFPPNYLHVSWRDYLYWDTELEN